MEEERNQKYKENQNQDRKDEEANLRPKFQPFCKFFYQFCNCCNVEYILSSLKNHLKESADVNLQKRDSVYNVYEFGEI